MAWRIRRRLRGDVSDRTVATPEHAAGPATDADRQGTNRAGRRCIPAAGVARPRITEYDPPHGMRCLTMSRKEPRQRSGQ